MRIVICSEKGGVGKTTVAANLVALLGQRGPTLAVDVDPQASLSEAFGVVAKGGDDSIAGLMSEEAPVEPRAVIHRGIAEGVHLIPAHRRALSRVNRELALEPGTHTTLRRALQPVAGDYQYVVLDTHGDTSDLTLNAICAADAVLGVTSARAWAARGVAALVAFLARQRRRELTDARFLGVVCAMYDRRGAEDRAVIDALRGTDLHVFEPYIPTSKLVASAALRQRPVVLSAPKSRGAAAYHELGHNVLLAMGDAHGC